MPRCRKLLELPQLATLPGPRLMLRAPQPGDAPAIYAYARDAEVTRYLAWPRHNSLADSERFLQRAVQGWQDGSELVWLIEDERGVVGAIGAELSKVNAGVGYVLTRDSWGRGYATEALGLVVEALFTHSPVRSIWALCVTENCASQRVLEKSGFHYVRTLSHYLACPNLGGEMKDVWLYGRERGLDLCR